MKILILSWLALSTAHNNIQFCLEFEPGELWPQETLHPPPWKRIHKPRCQTPLDCPIWALKTGLLFFLGINGISAQVGALMNQAEGWVGGIYICVKNIYYL